MVREVCRAIFKRSTLTNFNDILSSAIIALRLIKSVQGYISFLFCVFYSIVLYDAYLISLTRFLQKSRDAPLTSHQIDHNTPPVTGLYHLQVFR